MQLYLRRAKYMAGSDFDALIRLEQRKLQGLTAQAGAHINCEPLRSDTDRSFARIILSSTVDEPEAFARRITYLRSYLGAYTGAFRTGDTVYLSGKLVHLQDGDHDGFGIELTPWSVSKSYLANLTG
ncbi:MAG: hypothetical protein ACRDRX_24270 [Pseudonocardiaceae bacterium]